MVWAICARCTSAAHRGAGCFHHGDRRSAGSRASNARGVPRQGAMPDCMRELDARGLRSAVLEAAHNKTVPGICIGLQMLFEHSAEGDIPGLVSFLARWCVSPAICATHRVTNSRCRTWAGIRCTGSNIPHLRKEMRRSLPLPPGRVGRGAHLNTHYGPAFHRTRAFISCTVTTCSRR